MLSNLIITLHDKDSLMRTFFFFIVYLLGVPQFLLLLLLVLLLLVYTTKITSYGINRKVLLYLLSMNYGVGISFHLKETSVANQHN